MKVVLIGAATACGRVGPPGTGSAEDRALLEKMREATGAGLMGAGTLREDDPEMRGPGGGWPANRVRAIITASGDLASSNKKIFSQGPRPVVFCRHQSMASLEAALGGRAEIIGMDGQPQRLSVAAVVGRLGEMGVASLLIEGGPTLNYAALSEGVVDEILLTITPHVSGDGRVKSIVHGGKALGAPLLGLELISCRAGSSGEVFIRYRVGR